LRPPHSMDLRLISNIEGLSFSRVRGAYSQRGGQGGLAVAVLPFGGSGVLSMRQAEEDCF